MIGIDLGVGCMMHQVDRQEVKESWVRWSLIPIVNSCPCCGSAILPHFLACLPCLGRRRKHGGEWWRKRFE